MDDKSKILLVEDDVFISRAYKDGLTQAGFDVISTGNGEEAWEKIKSEKPDLILLDLILPIKNGFELLSDLKLHNDLKNIPVIILSNLGQMSDIKKGEELGAVDYLIKSDFSLREVVEKVKEYLAKSKIKGK